MMVDGSCESLMLELLKSAIKALGWLPESVVACASHGGSAES